METFRSDLSHKTFPKSERVQGRHIRPSLLEFIQKEQPGFKADDYLAYSELNQLREAFISDYLINQTRKLTRLERDLIKSTAGHETVAEKMDSDQDKPLTLGQRVADKVASFGGSWTFIISFGGFLATWIAVNAIFLANEGFDPYPFILLNLILSCIAALQAPVIMMSQNRQEEKDRERAKSDYMVNLKSELEIRALHEKVDHLIIHHQQELMEIQRIQIEMMADILQRVDRSGS